MLIHLFSQIIDSPNHAALLTSFGQDSVAFGYSNIDQDRDDIRDFHMKVGSSKVLVLRCSNTFRNNGFIGEILI